MIRVLLGLAIPALAVAAAAASLVGKGVLFAPRGEAMIVASGPAAGGAVQHAKLDGTGCLAAELLAEAAAPKGAAPDAQRIVTFEVPAGTDRIAVVLQEIPAADPSSGPTLVLAVDAEGRILAVSEDMSGGWRKVANDAEDCLPAAPARKLPGSV